ncbi:MAG TPA: cupin domain-containing protein [Candidatus Rubrimentiphilum sp.]|nr:cupin domain-containing protein [Candidatus Rubrimentiphilum sp.]
MKTNITNQPYAADVQQLARRNSDFRQVLNTTERSQLVLMCVPAGGEIGQEIHAGTDQILVFAEGNGKAIFADEQRTVAAGDVVVVPAGTQHNFVADSSGALKLFTIYTPPHHRPGTVHATKADADADTSDQYVASS